VILDDIFPHLLSAFRVAEYNTYLARYPDAVAYSTATAFRLIREERDFNGVRNEYEARYPQFRGRVFPYDPSLELRNALVYTVFLNNVYTFLDRIEQDAAPFIFTLYPGGGFQLAQPESDQKLRAVLSSPHLRQVIVTQRVTHQYLLDLGICRPEQIVSVYGGVLPADLPRPRRHYYKRDKDTFDVCFVAQKYMPSGADKGFDVFVAVANKLASLHPDVRFHIVGGFEASDGKTSDLGGRIHFYGPRLTGFFQDFYANMDCILSPNEPFMLSPGGFDGFPTGSCIEAGLCGVPVFCTDPLRLNTSFRDGEEIVIIPHDAHEIVTLVEAYYHSPARLAELSRKGEAAFKRVFDPGAQMAPRLRLMEAGLRGPSAT
jgi:glycosyltransferase involved in cell wall biosynthesis